MTVSTVRGDGLKIHSATCFRRIVAAGLAVSFATAARASPLAQATAYPMTASAWSMAPPILPMGDEAAVGRFRRYEGMPTGTLTLNEGVAVSRTARFTTGAIDFDIKPLGYDDAGVVFHRHGPTDGEFVYLRANPDCPAANDCIQYVPITRTVMAWNIYSNFQGPAPISPTGWNHVHIEVAGEGMRVYVNHEARPSLVVPRLWGLTRDGGVALKGPAVFANLVIDPSPSPPIAPVSPSPVEPGTVTAWLAAPPTVYRRDRPVLIRDMPAATSFGPIEVEPTGLVNLGRAFGLAQAPSPSLAWLKTEVAVPAPVRRTLSLGFAEQAWVFLNGRLVYSGENQYFPEKSRLSVDGRLEPDNAVIPLDLRKGENEIVLAVGNDWRSHAGPLEPSPYGWGAEAHIGPADATAASTRAPHTLLLSAPK